MIRRGNKLYELKIPRNNKCNEVIFRDSFNLCPVALGKLVGAFGLQITEKQFFPHLANIPENYGRTLQQLPLKSDYLYGGMPPQKQNEFDKSYEEEKINNFAWMKPWPNIAQMMFKYKRCSIQMMFKYNVQILTEALVAFRKNLQRLASRKTQSLGQQQKESIF
uniref:DNA-directed DNA polymerase n=1 Tax=Meloidogyne incognita TaxID=6306 RepID=A0A914KMX7_MELIC